MQPKVKEYKIVDGRTATDTSEEVTSLIQNGWVLYESLALFGGDHGRWYAQAMVLYETSDGVTEAAS